MRLLSLACTQVGHWTTLLPLALSPRFTVVLGDNEAGKSTLRRAIRALLFGPDKALAAPLTVAGFEMSAHLDVDGPGCSIHRKGRHLQGVLHDSVAALLNDANAGRFDSLFDLTHDNLWPQDHGFLKADGALGSLMFGARTGVSPAQLQQARQHIDESLKDIDSAKQGNRGIPWHQKMFVEAKARHEKLARFSENDALSEQHRALVAQVRQLDAKLTGLDAESRRLKELIAGADDVERLEHDRQLSDALLTVGAPPSVATVAGFSQRLARVEELARELAGKRKALVVATEAFAAAEAPGDLHALVEQCDALRGVVAMHAADVQAFQDDGRRHAQQHASLAEVLERLGVAGGEEPVTVALALLRPEPLAAQLREMLGTRAGLINDAKQKRALLAAAKRTLDGVSAESEDAGDTAVEALDAALPFFGQACDAENEIARLRKAQDDAAPVLQRQHAALGLAADVAGPDALELPSADAAMQAEQALAAAYQGLKSAQAHWRRSDGELKSLQEQLAERRQQIGSVASAEDIAQARALRDSRLEALCAGLAETGGRVESLPALVGRAGELRTLVRQTDLLLDRRMEAGKTLGELHAGEQQAAQLARQLDEARVSVESAEVALSQAQQAVAALWPFMAGSPASAGTWLAQYEAWRVAWDAQQQRGRELAHWSDTLAGAQRDALAILGGALPPLEGFASARAMQEEVVRERNARVLRAGRIEVLRRQRQDARAEGKAAEAFAEESQEALAVWQQQWDSATRALPDGLERQPAAIERWLALQDELRRLLGEIETLQASMAARTAVIAEKRQRIDTLLHAAIARSADVRLPPDIEPAAAFTLVDAACRASASRLSLRNALARDRDEAERAVAVAVGAHDTTQSALLKDWGDAGIGEVCTRDVLATLHERATEVEKLGKQIAHAEAGLRGRWGDQVSAGIAEIRSSGVAALGARLTDVDAELEQTGAERGGIADARRDADTALKALQQGHDAAGVTQELSDAREALLDKVEERYSLQVARLILDRAHRAASDGGQGLEQVASGYFRTLTGGAYSGLRINDEESGAPVLVAVESARNEKSLGDLSAGTRDQLWLALRLAGIVAAARETPFPLLLDDSLVQFDDSRATAALQLLHEVSGHVQVVLFTHHDHLADLAEAAIPSEDLSIVVLPGVSGEMRERAARGRRSPSRDRPVPPVGEDEADADGLDGPDARVDGRRRRSGTGDREEAKQLILQILAGADEPLGKAAILEAAAAQGLSFEKDWAVAIGELTADGSVLQSGQRKGARYSAPPLAN